MNNTKLRNILFFALMIFFGLQLISRFISAIGSRTSSPQFYKISALCFPFESEPFHRYAYMRLNESLHTDPTLHNITGIKESIASFKRSISHNPFEHRSHFNLGRAYLSLLPLDEETFAKGMDSIKRAIHLQGGKDTLMSRRAVGLMVKYWQRLSDEDKQLCNTLLKKVIHRIEDDSFDSLLANWELNCKDVKLFDGVLEKTPRHYQKVADALTRLEKDMNYRRLFLLNHEIFTLAKVAEKYRALSNQSPNLLEQLESLRLRLKQNIPGYYRLIRNNKFRKQFHRDLLKRLDFHILSRLLTNEEAKILPRHQEKLQNFIHSCIEDFTTSEDLEDLYEFLDREKFFHTKDIPVSYIKGRLLFGKQDYSALILQMEELRYAAAAALTGQDNKEYLDALLLLSDAYISSRLLTKALTVLAEIKTYAPQSMELYRQSMKIESTIGAEKVGQDRLKYYDIMRASRFLQVDQTSLDIVVYIVDNNVIELRFTDSLKEQIKSFHLLQVYIDHHIRFEAYLSQLKEPVKVKVFPYERFSKHTVLVKII